MDVGKAAAVVDFVLSPSKAWPAMYYSKDNFGPESAYHEFSVDQSLDKIVEYAYSPTIPSQAVIPSSIRVSVWKNLNGEAASWSWKYPAKNGQTQSFGGVEREETTPDVFSGTYYGYDLDRLLVLGRHGDRHVFFSVSRQKEKSPGKKAFALGGDSDWTYLYTDENGMNKAGMGWVTPYMYESFAVTVFVEESPEQPSKVKCAMFKWLSAGAGGVNMVATRHINAGIRRFESAFRTVLEHPDLPPPMELSETFLQIESLPMDGIKKEIDLYFRRIVDRYRQDEVFKDDDLAELFTSREYLDALTGEQMKGILGVEYMKHVLGKNPIINIGRILSRTAFGAESQLARIH
jgi:hypothetical protein